MDSHSRIDLMEAGSNSIIWSDDWLVKNSKCTYNGKLKSNQKYIIKISYCASGNFIINLNFTKDEIGDTKEASTAINCNQDIVSSIDGYNDSDYFSFVAQANGPHYFKFINTSVNTWLYFSIHKWSTEERLWYDDLYTNYSQTTTLNLEQGQKYYISVYYNSSYTYTGNYTFSISNQTVSSIQLSPSSIKMNKGEETTLSPTILPANAYNRNVKWESSDSDVASVSNDGSVYARKAGRAVITCTSTDGSNVKASCEVIVLPGKCSSLYSNSTKNTSSKVNLSWDTVYGADGYTIYCYDTKAKKWQAVKDNISPKTTSATLKSCIYNKKSKALSAATVYKFRVAAYVKANGQKIYGSQSDTYSIATAPAKVKIRSVSYKRSTHRVTVKWKKTANATGYKIYYKSPSSNTYYLFATVKGSKKQSATFYYYPYTSGKFTFKVCAYKSSGDYRESIGSGTTKKQTLRP